MKVFKLLVVLSLGIFSTAYAQTINIRIENNSGMNFEFTSQAGYWQNVPATIANQSKVQIVSPDFDNYSYDELFAINYASLENTNGFGSDFGIYLKINATTKKFTYDVVTTFLDANCSPEYKQNNLVAIDCKLSPPTPR